MKSELMALRGRKYTLVAKARELLAKAGNENRDLTATESAEYERLMAQVSQTEAQIIEADAAQDARNRESMPPGTFMIDGGGNGHWRQVGDLATAGIMPRPGRKRSWESIFGPAHGASNGFKSLGDFMRSVSRAGTIFDPRLNAASTESVPDSGGFLVPTEYAAQILQDALENAIVLPRAQIWPMKSDSLKVPATKDEDHSSSVLYGGVAAGWAAELEDLTEAAVKFRQVGLGANKLGMITNASNELVEDSTFEGVITAKLQEAAQWFLDQAFFFGDGAGKPLGMLTAGNNALVTVDKESSQPSNSFVYENACAMFSAMAPRSRQRAEWVISDSLVPWCFKLQNVVTNKAGSENVGGSAVPTFQMNADGTGTLLGRPVTFTEKLSAAGDLYDVAFIDFTSYIVGMRREIAVDRSNQAGFKNYSTWCRLVVRCDGQPAWEHTLKLKNGDVVSPYVTLQAR